MSKELSIDLQILSKVRNLVPPTFRIERAKKWSVLKRKGLVQKIFLKSLDRFKLEQTNKYDEFCDALDKALYGNSLDVIKQFDFFKESIKPKILPGFQFGQVGGVEVIDTETWQSKKANFATKKNSTDVLVFWSSEIEKSTRGLKELNTWLSQNQNLKLQINPIAISLDDDSNNCKTFLKEHQITQFQHYRFSLGWDPQNSFQRALELNHLPKIVVSGKKNEVIGITRKARDIEQIVKSYWEAGDESDEDGEEVEKHRDVLEQQSFRFIKKALTQQVADLLSENKSFAKTDFIRLSLKKSYRIAQDGAKQIVERTPLKVAYEVSVQTQQIIKQFLNNVTSILGKDNVAIKRSIVKDPNGMVDMIQTSFEDVLKKNYKVIQDYVVRTEYFNYVHDKEEFQPDVSVVEKKAIQNLTFKEYQTMFSQIFPIFLKYQQEIDDSDDDSDNDEEQEEDKRLIFEKVDELTNCLRSGLELTLGQPFQTIEDYHLYGKEETTVIEHKDDQILVVLYWDDNQECQRYFRQVIKLILQNEEQFKDKVQFAALAHHKFKEYEMFFLKNEGLHEVIPLYFPIEDHQADRVQYSVKSYPHFVIVDKVGCIRILDQVEDLETTVLTYLEETIESLNQKGPLNDDEYSEITQFLYSDSKKKLQTLNNKRTFQLSFVFKEVDQGEKIARFAPIIQYTIREGKEKYLDNYLALLNKVVPLSSFQINKTIQRTLNLLFPGKTCQLCQQDLSEATPQFYSPFSDEFYCVKCAEAGDPKAYGYDKFRIKDNLIFINAPLVDKSVLNDIDISRIGNNLKVKKGEPYSQNHALDCNGCDGDVKGFRYIVLNCLPGKLTNLALVDFCQECFEQIRTSGPKLEKIVKRTSIYGYNPSMLLLRIPFYQGYYDY